MHHHAFREAGRIFHNRYLHTNTINFKANYLEIDIVNHVLCEVGSSVGERQLIVSQLQCNITRTASQLPHDLNVVYNPTPTSNITSVFWHHDMKSTVGHRANTPRNLISVIMTYLILILFKEALMCRLYNNEYEADYERVERIRKFPSIYNPRVCFDSCSTVQAVRLDKIKALYTVCTEFNANKPKRKVFTEISRVIW
jgi:hypothetical protein